MAASNGLSAACRPGEEPPRQGLPEVRYQAKIDLKRRCLAGAEVCVTYPGIGAPPGQIPLEDAIRLTEFSLLSAMRDWTEFAEAGFNLHLTLNAPGEALLSLPIVRVVEESRPASGGWPGLILQIDEDQIVRGVAQAQSVAAELKAHGVGIAVDNFGAGFSSFAGLRNIPLAEIRIDATFVKNCAAEVSNAAICQTAIDLAHRFGSMATAKGIETMQDLQALVVMGCDFGQGPMIAPAMPKHHFVELLRQRLNRPRAEAAPSERAGGVA